jgi:hypothetical protein
MPGPQDRSATGASPRAATPCASPPATRFNATGGTVSTYAQLKSEIDALQARAAEALKAEKHVAIQEIVAKIAQYGISAAELGLMPVERKVGRPPKRTDDAVGTATLNLGENAQVRPVGATKMQ